MKFTRLAIPDIILIEPDVFGDDRGFFFESFNQEKFAEATDLSPTFIQDNHSKSTMGVLRGLHYQLPPKAQGKLVRVVQGEVFDVAVDIRRSSPTFGKWVGEYLSAENKKQIWIPEGFAHAFMTITETAEFLYKTTNYYSPEHERSIRWDDPDIGIDWVKDVVPILSAKDAKALGLKDAEIFA
jgi:dTDP-4-dehydrorhamnose 3,5-epimerase